MNLNIRFNIFNKNISSLFLLFASLNTGLAIASENINTIDSNINQSKDKTLINSAVKKDQYILAPGDTINIQLLGLPEYSGIFSIGPDGYLTLPEIKEYYVTGMTLKDLKNGLIRKYSEYVIDPDLFIQIVGYRPIRVFVKGEVQSPGLYTLKGLASAEKSDYTNNLLKKQSLTSQPYISTEVYSQTFSSQLYPTLFDAIKASQGITAYSDLSKVIVRRNNPISQGGGMKQANINFLSLFNEGDQSKNIRLYDGDTIIIPKSKKILSDQLTNARNSNLSPNLIRVFVSGNVLKPGEIIIPRGSGLNQAIAMTGGKQIFSGQVELLRFNNEGQLDKKQFFYNSSAKITSKKNPTLQSGDIINIKRSVLGITTEVIGKVAQPIVGVYALIELFD